jgi:hypothetical protein
MRVAALHRRNTRHEPGPLPARLTDLPRRLLRPSDLPGAGRARLFRPSRTVPASCAEVGGGRRGAPAAGAALCPARVRRELGRVGLADYPARAQAIPGTTSGEAKPENAIVIDTGEQRPNPSAIEVLAMYRVLYLGAQDSPPVNYQFIHIPSRRVRRLHGHRGLALPVESPRDTELRRGPE